VIGVLLVKTTGHELLNMFGGHYPPVIKRCMENHQMIFQQYLQFPIAMFDYQRVMTDYGSFIGAHVSYVQTWGRPSKWQFY